ncbi:MAG: 7-carboxy-7-deazaguanine synthase QueE [Methylococcales symbiont of Hymedesmia sp. n. MRB-2018]|nr:MAG: 7-carboxy-7-deazaguanine synthase QueE [Methylococcales symbiont of Hymedesmia sp. n. MRB-2018]KAF3983541.1 MAG: 7-carboxy-7-deazaguanine synthase QueE [Methylococcales symbiont of Hymedesmia sp. n. MRB-2018]
MELSLKITEIFFSLQGESNTVGLPTVFIRLTGCPLRCSYCDTAYAFSGGKKMALSEIIDQVALYNTQFVTVTGGEPLAQSACLDLIALLADKDYKVSLETSGAIDISKVDQRVIKVMDLKTPSSGEIEKNLYQNIQYLTKKDQLKFVIADDKDYQWSKSMMREKALSDQCEVLFSPVMGAMKPVELADKIIQDQLPVRFQIQLHKYLWGDIQGK